MEFGQFQQLARMDTTAGRMQVLAESCQQL